jgi:hypothetical protein
MKIFWAVIAALILMTSVPVAADEIVLKNGMKVTSAITGRSDQWVKVDVSGVTVTYYNDEIESINGKTHVPAAMQLAQQVQDGVPVVVTHPSAVETVNNPPVAATPVVPAQQPPALTPPAISTEGSVQNSAAPVVTVTSASDGKTTVTKRPIRPVEAILGLAVFAGVFLIVFGVLFYPLFLISKKTGIGSPIFAFIPILNLYLMVQVAGRPVWWMILLLVPLANIIANVIIWMDIAVVRQKPAWMGILVLVPFANIAMMWYLALVDS